jgi:hypothetical protein
MISVDIVEAAILIVFASELTCVRAKTKLLSKTKSQSNLRRELRASKVISFCCTAGGCRCRC